MKILGFLAVFLTRLVFGDVCPDLTSEQQKAAVTGLEEQVYQHDVYYFEHHAPRISDAEYDQLNNRLKFLERCFPDIPVRRFKPELSSNKARHIAFMGSLKKAVDEEDIKTFLQTFNADTILLQPKIDGIAVELIYEKGRLSKAITRGNGEQGENISRHIKHMPLIPQQLPKPINLVLHGELFARLDLAGDSIMKKYVSARHFVAGQVNRNEPELKSLETIDFFPWHWIDAPFSSENNVISALNKLGFKHPLKYTHSINLLEDISRLRDRYGSAENEIFLMDGVVIKSADIQARSNSELNASSPDWAIAWKFPAKTAITTVVDIEFSKGKTGKVTPVLIVSPVTIDGRVIQRVSLGSINQYREKDIVIGDQVSIKLKGSATPVFGKVIFRGVE